jgi:putative MATE family efflux protein
MSQLTASYKEIWKLSWPILIGNVAYMLISVFDTAFMGRVGVVEQGAIGLSAQFYMILFMIGYSFTKGTQILIAKREGERRYLRVGIIFDNSMIFLTLLGILIFIIFYFFSGTLLGWIISDPATHKAATIYLQTRSWGAILSFYGSVFIAYYSGINRTNILAASVVTMSLFNIALNYVLIFGKLGMPAMGIKGAAIASNLAEGIALVIMIYGLWRQKLRPKHQMFKFTRFERRLVREMTNISVPLIAQHIIGLGAWLLFFVFIEKMGKLELASANVVKQIYMFFGIPTYAFTTAANTVIGNLHGQGKSEEIYPALKRLIYLSLLFSIGLGIILVLFPKPFILIFNDDAALIEVSRLSLNVSVVALFCFAIATILFNAIVSLGLTKVSLLIEVVTILIYLAYIYMMFEVLHVSLPVAWTSEIVYWLGIGGFSFLYLYRGTWKKLFIPKSSGK